MNCDAEAVALLTFSPPEAKAWLYDLEKPDSTGGIMLCRKHANATVVPMSWQLIDARDPAWPGPVGSQPVLQAMAAASVEEFLPTRSSSSYEASTRYDASSQYEDNTEREVRMQPERSVERDRSPLDRPIERELAQQRRDVMIDTMVDSAEVDDAADESLFELPISDIPAVTPYPR